MQPTAGEVLDGKPTAAELKRACLAAHKGVAIPPDSATALVREFVQRQRLSKIGLSAPLDSIDADKAERLVFVSGYLDELRAQDMKQKTGKGRRG